MAEAGEQADPAERTRGRVQSVIAGTPEQWSTIIAVLIGLASVLAAVLTYRAVVRADQAGSADQLAVFETARLEATRAGAEVRLRGEQTAGARYSALIAEADLLEGLAENAVEEAAARQLSDRARALREVADNLSLELQISAYLEGEGDATSFDVEKRRADLAAQDENTSRLNPDETSATADRLHDRSVRLAALAVVLVLALALLTGAELTRGTVRTALASGGALIAVAATAVGLLGDKV